MKDSLFFRADMLPEDLNNNREVCKVHLEWFAGLACLGDPQADTSGLSAPTVRMIAGPRGPAMISGWLPSRTTGESCDRSRPGIMAYCAGASSSTDSLDLHSVSDRSYLMD